MFLKTHRGNCDEQKIFPLLSGLLQAEGIAMIFQSFHILEACEVGLGPHWLFVTAHPHVQQSQMLFTSIFIKEDAAPWGQSHAELQQHPNQDAN